MFHYSGPDLYCEECRWPILRARRARPHTSIRARPFWRITGLTTKPGRSAARGLLCREGQFHAGNSRHCWPTPARDSTLFPAANCTACCEPAATFQGRVFRRGQDRGRGGIRAGAGIHMFNCESGPELALIDALAARRGVTGELRHPRQSRCGRVHASLHFDRAAPSTNSASTSRKPKPSTSARAPLPQPGGRRRELPYRLATDGHRPDSGSSRPRAGAGATAAREWFRDRHLDLGGGLGIAYQAHEQAPGIRGFIEQVRAKLPAAGCG